MKKCKECNKELLGKYQTIFCSNSCAASFNNRKRPKKVIQKLNKCLNCNNIVKRETAIYCSNKCQQSYVRNTIFECIEKNIPNEKITTRKCKRYLIHKYGEKCMKCGWSIRHKVTNKVPIELNHIDGNSENNKISNLELLCPNCHSLTETFKALNVGNGRHKRRERYRQGKSF